MREATYTDPEGRNWLVLLPDGAGDEQLSIGMRVCPQPIDDLGLPLHIEVTIHNELFARQICDYETAQGRMADVMQAVRAAYRIDAHRIIELWYAPVE